MEVSMAADGRSGSAFPATLALQIRQLEPQGFKLDGVVTVIDCVNFRGYEDKSPSAKVGWCSNYHILRPTTFYHPSPVLPRRLMYSPSWTQTPLIL
jgi:hypothetical protein